MGSKKFSIVSLAAAVLALVLVIGVMTVFAACGMKEDGTWMHCHDTQIAIAVCGAVVAVALALATFLKGKGAKVALYVIAIIGCIAVLAFPEVLPMCKMDTMRCHAVMAPFARVAAGLVGVLSIVSLVQAARAGSKDLPKYGEL